MPQLIKKAEYVRSFAELRYILRLLSVLRRGYVISRRLVKAYGFSRRKRAAVPGAVSGKVYKGIKLYYIWWLGGAPRT